MAEARRPGNGNASADDSVPASSDDQHELPDRPVAPNCLLNQSRPPLTLRPRGSRSPSISEQVEEPLCVARAGEVVEHDVRRRPTVDQVPEPAQLLVGVDVP
jgi:hypothetical protein